MHQVDNIFEVEIGLILAFWMLLDFSWINALKYTKSPARNESFIDLKKICKEKIKKQKSKKADQRLRGGNNDKALMK